MSNRRTGLLLCSAFTAFGIADAAEAQTALAGPATSTTQPVTSDAVPSATKAAPQVAATNSFDGVQEIIVTAQKRNETANKVGLSITALPGKVLVQERILAPADLVRVVPGFTATEAPRGTPIYAIRGIGFDDSTLGSNSTVALYTDEVPLSFPVEARFATLDLERVEVLKGPQGILFGQNSTAGAINFIAAKPTKQFHAGVDASYGRFNTTDLRGFISAPLTNTLGVRVSALGTHADGWQRSYTRDATLGAKRQFAGRMIVEWTPITDLKLSLNINGWIDHSDTQASQLLESFPLIAPAALPAFDSYPRSPETPRAADWDVNPTKPLRRHDSFLQVSLRGDYSLTPEIVLTSITAFTRYNQRFTQDTDGTNLTNFTLTNTGSIRSFNQEVRLTGDMHRLKWIVGGNYSHDNAFDSTFFDFKDGSAFRGFLGIKDGIAFADQPNIRSIAGFGNADFAVSDVITLHGGLRYTRDKRSFSGCTRDPGTDGSYRNAFNIVLGLVGTPNEIQPNGCITSSNGIPGVVRGKLDEGNLSFRVGVDAQVTPTTLVYANVSRGYKSGSFPALNAASALQYAGVTQESVIAYETGIKAGLFDRKIQINAAAFYYDYTNKQLRGRRLDPLGIFGVLDLLVNIPKSRVYGAEMSLQVVPFAGFALNVAGTYVNSKVTKDFIAFDPVGNLFNYKGLSFPHTPKYNLTASADYDFAVSDSLGAFVGSNILYASKTVGLFNRPDLIGKTRPSPTLRSNTFLNPNIFDVKAYTTVDVRAGIKDPNGRWRVWLYGQNIFNTYYYSNVTQSLDNIYRLANMGATYGVSASFRF